MVWRWGIRCVHQRPTYPQPVAEEFAENDKPTTRTIETKFAGQGYRSWRRVLTSTLSICDLDHTLMQEGESVAKNRYPDDPTAWMRMNQTAAMKAWDGLAPSLQPRYSKHLGNVRGMLAELDQVYAKADEQKIADLLMELQKFLISCRLISTTRRIFLAELEARDFIFQEEIKWRLVVSGLRNNSHISLKNGLMTSPRNTTNFNAVIERLRQAEDEGPESRAAFRVKQDRTCKHCPTADQVVPVPKNQISNVRGNGAHSASRTISARLIYVATVLNGDPGHRSVIPRSLAPDLRLIRQR